MYILLPYIYMEYTWYIPTIYLIIWNPTHLDRIRQNGTYVSEPCTYMSVQVHTSSWIHEHVCT